MKRHIPWRFLIHLWTLAGLGFAVIAAMEVSQGKLETAARWLLLVLVVDHTDGTLARAFRVRQHLPRVSGETLDLVTDVVGLTCVPLLFCWRAGIFLPGWGSLLTVAGAMTCSYKYSLKAQVLADGYSPGAPPAFFSLLLFWLLGLPQAWATGYAVSLIVLCWLPIRYPISSLVTTHWKPGFASLINYASFLAMIPAMIWLRDGPHLVYWPVLILMLFHLFAAPALLAAGVIRPGFHRVY
jgi:phosphatidylcholine synthase